MRAPVRLVVVLAMFVPLGGSIGYASEDARPGTPAGQAEARRLDALPPVSPPKGKRIAVDPSGRKQVGKASVYAHTLAGRPMADGKPFSPHADVAASKTLPIGTTAKVTNTDSGRSATVKVEDRGPFVDRRVVDLSPKAAAQLGIGKENGVAPVVVAPVAVPQRDGTVKAGAGATESR
jgi:rare lipoprotein A